VSKALHWLKLNHIDYYDCSISERNLASYPDEGPPVVVDYYTSSLNKDPESTSIHDMEEEDGTTEGPCPFIVHGITGEELSTKTMKTIKAIALRHLTSEAKYLHWTCRNTRVDIWKSSIIPCYATLAVSVWFRWYRPN